MSSYYDSDEDDITSKEEVEIVDDEFDTLEEKYGLT